MRLVAVADLHGILPEIPPCDVLVIAGDLCPGFGINGRLVSSSFSRAGQVEWLGSVYARWEREVPAGTILLTPGNHDWFVPEDVTERLHLRTRCLVDGDVAIEGLRFYLTPWTPPFLSWNYMLDGKRRKARLSVVPRGLDVLVSHGPPLGIGDLTSDGVHAGDPLLLEIARRKQPRVMVFGHIHEGWGGPYTQSGNDRTQMWNTSRDPFGTIPRPPLILDLTATTIAAV